MSSRAVEPLSTEDRLALLRLARQAIAARVCGAPGSLPPAPGARLQSPQGAFVTLKVRGDLRGCIGMIEPIRSLWETVAHCAAAAAAEDPRFSPIEPSEIEALDLEITVLALPVPVTGHGPIVPGRHGLIVTSGHRRGVLLPQVATEQGWDVPTFVRETVRKAGLPPDALRRGEAELLMFEAEIVSAEPSEPTGAAPGSPARSPGETG